MGKQRFMGTVQGRAGETSRLGSKLSGLRVEAAGWQGRIVVCLEYDPKRDRDVFSVYLKPHWSDSGDMKKIASGVLDHRALKDPYIPALIA